MLPWQPFLAFYIWGAHWRHLKNTTEPSMCGGDAALCQITLTTCSCCEYVDMDLHNYVYELDPFTRLFGRNIRTSKILTHHGRTQGVLDIKGFIPPPKKKNNMARMGLNN